MEQPQQGARTSVWVLAMVIALFFAWGFSTVLIDTLVPKLKGLFTLGYAEVMLTQFSFFLAYLFFSVPAGLLLARIGYVHAIVVGLLVMMAGCLLFAPAAMLGVYPGFLVALFTLAAGITVLQVAANPLVALLGTEATSHSRLNLAQAFNSLGTAIGPYIGSVLVLSGTVTVQTAGLAPDALAALRRTEAHVVQIPFLGIAAGLFVLAAAFWFLRRSIRLPRAEAATLGSTLALLKNPRLALGMASIFIYVGAEVTIGSVMANYLMSPNRLATTAEHAGKLVSLYWLGAMIGRFIGSEVLRHVRAGLVLSFNAVVAGVLVLIACFGSGAFAAYALLAVGLFNSIMFPTIFTIAIEGEDAETPQASSLLCMAIVGGAVIPVLTGTLADHVGLALSLLVPLACYLWIATYGWLGRNPVTANAVGGTGG